MPDLNEYPGCGACDEYGHPILCEQCIWDGRCALQPYDMEENDDENS